MEYDEIVIETSDDVYSPSEDSRLAARMISLYLSSREREELHVLDLGTATGILGIFAATKSNVQKVTCADINHSAVGLARKNADRNKDSIHAEMSFLATDLFSDIPEKEVFDLIIFNAPYLRSEAHKDLNDPRWSGGKEGVELSIRFLEQSVLHLNNDGAIVLVCSSLSNTPKLKTRIKELGLRITEQLKEHYFFEDILVWLINPMY